MEFLDQHFQMLVYRKSQLVDRIKSLSNPIRLERGYKVLILVLILASVSCSQKTKNNLPKVENNGTLKVMSYNIHHANPPSKVGFIDLDAIAAVINRENPDLVGLQEVDKFTKRSGNIDQAKQLAEKTGMFYHFFKAIDHDGGDYGLAILSRFPIQKSVNLPLPQVSKAESRALSFVEVSLPNRTQLRFSNTHLDATRLDSNRVVQMKSILKTLVQDKMITILVGDLNCEAKSEPIVLLDQSFTRSCISNCAGTIPEIKPTKTIDYVAIRNSNWKVLEHRVIPETYASDHRPLVVVYQLN